MMPFFKFEAAAFQWLDGYRQENQTSRFLRYPVQVLVQCLAHSLAGLAVFSFGPLPQLTQQFLRQPVGAHRRRRCLSAE
jgi:hypothetical protein